MYDYGGESGLDYASKNGKGFLDFNFEQQASIVADYYLSHTRSFPKAYANLLKEFSETVLSECE